MESYNIGPESYLEHLQRVKKAVDIPVIGSLNGISEGTLQDRSHSIVSFFRMRSHNLIANLEHCHKLEFPNYQDDVIRSGAFTKQVVE